MASTEGNESKNKLQSRVLILTVLILILVGTVVYLARINYGVDDLLKAFESNGEYTILLDEFLLNVKSEGSMQRYLKITVALMHRDEKQNDYIESNINKIRDVILSTLRSKTYEEMLDNSNIEDIKNEIVKNINHNLKEDLIEEIYFTDLILQ